MRGRRAQHAYPFGPRNGVEAPAPDGRVAVALRYPTDRPLRDFTFRPQDVRGGSVRFRIGQRDIEVRRRRGSVFARAAPAGARVVVSAGAARDRFGNRNGRALTNTGG